MFLFDLNIFAVQPNFVTRGIASKLDAFIMGLLLKFLSVMEVLFRFGARVGVFFVRHPEGDSHSLTQKACGRSLYSWRCYMQTQPLVET